MTKKLSKALIVAVLICAIAVGGAGMAYAAGVSSINVYIPYSISVKANTNMAIDIPFNNPASNPTLFPKDLSKKNQRWTVGRYGSYVWVYADLTIGTSSQRVLSDSDSGRIILVSENAASSTYSAIDFLTLGSSYYRMYLPNVQKYIGAASSWVEAALWAQGYNETSDLQKWYVET